MIFMNEINLLYHQTKDTYQWVQRLLQDVPEDQWGYTPNIVNTNLSWQIGHLVISYYYHSILVIKGHDMNVLSTVPIKEYAEWYTYTFSPDESARHQTPEHLQTALRHVAEASLSTIHELTPETLSAALEPSRQPHPVASTKREALYWNIKHTFWHCGQIALWRRTLGVPVDFGLF